MTMKSASTSRAPLLDNTNSGCSSSGSNNSSVNINSNHQFPRTSNPEDVTKWMESIQVDKLEELLRRDQEKLDCMDEGGMTLLHRSVLTNRLEIVQLLVSLGANTTLANRDGWSALHLAAHSGKSDILAFLLKT